jgi:hypothetical protein
LLDFTFVGATRSRRAFGFSILTIAREEIADAGSAREKVDG